MEKRNDSGSTTLYHPTKIRLTKPEKWHAMEDIDNISYIDDWSEFDLVLLRADFDKNRSKRGFQGKTGFDFLEIDFDIVPEGTEAYSFGYPLPHYEVMRRVGFHYFCPWTTSAIISSHHHVIGPAFGEKFPKYYIIDKELAYGNSGGPLVVKETGKVVSVCIAFQPLQTVVINNMRLTIPSTYGITSSLKNIEVELRGLI